MTIEIELKNILIGVLALIFAYFTVFNFYFFIFALLIGIVGFAKAKKAIGDKRYLFFAKLLNFVAIVCSILLCLYYLSNP